MGYVFIILVGGLFVLVLVVAAMRGSRKVGGKTLGADDVTPHQPAAAEPTPGASSTEPERQVDSAQKRVPPS